MRLLTASILVACGLYAADGKSKAVTDNCSYSWNGYLPSLTSKSIPFDISELDEDALYNLGQYSILTHRFNIAASLSESELPIILKSLYRYRQLCPSEKFSPSHAIKPYWELVQILENVVDFSELGLLTEFWSEKYSSAIAPDVMLEHLKEVFSLSAVNSVKTILLQMGSGPNSPTSKELMKSLQALGLNIIFADGRSDMLLDDLVDEYLVDMIISDGVPLVSERHQDRVFMIGKSHDSKWSLSLENELKQVFSFLAQAEESVMIYSMVQLDGIEDMLMNYPQFRLKTFKDYSEASHYFSSKICDRSDNDCISSLNEQVFLVIGNTKQSAFINNFLRVAQDARDGRNKDAKVYVTSMATWGGIEAIERRDLANTLLFDARRLSEAGLGYSQSSRIAALVRDLISIYENQSIGADYRFIPYLGYTGRYFVDERSVEREIDLIKFSELK